MITDWPPNATLAAAERRRPSRRRGWRGLREHASLLNLAGVSDDAGSAAGRARERWAATHAPERFGEGYFQDPPAHFAALRESRPVAPVIMPGTGGRAWMITRYEDVRAALADPRLSKDVRRVRPDYEPDPVSGALSMHLLSLDPPTLDR